MTWKIEYSNRALKSLKKLDRSAAQRVVDFMKQRVAVLNDPRILGKPLKGELGLTAPTVVNCQQTLISPNTDKYHLNYLIKVCGWAFSHILSLPFNIELASVVIRARNYPRLNSIY